MSIRIIFSPFLHFLSSPKTTIFLQIVELCYIRIKNHLFDWYGIERATPDGEIIVKQQTGVNQSNRNPSQTANRITCTARPSWSRETCQHCQRPRGWRNTCPGRRTRGRMAWSQLPWLGQGAAACRARGGRPWRSPGGSAGPVSSWSTRTPSPAIPGTSPSCTSTASPCRPRASPWRRSAAGVAGEWRVGGGQRERDGCIAAASDGRRGGILPRRPSYRGPLLMRGSNRWLWGRRLCGRSGNKQNPHSVFESYTPRRWRGRMILFHMSWRDRRRGRSAAP